MSEALLGRGRIRSVCDTSPASVTNEVLHLRDCLRWRQRMSEMETERYPEVPVHVALHYT